MLYLQPQGGPAKIDWSNPITRGLVLCVIPIGGTFYDAFSNQFATCATTRIYRKPVGGSSQALSLKGANSATPSAKFPNQTGFDKIVGPFTLFAEASLELNATTQDVIKSWEGNNAYGLGLSMDDDGTVLNGFFGRVDQSPSSLGINGILGSNSEQFSHRIAFDSDGTNRHFYAYGDLKATVASSALPSASTSRRTYILSNFDPTANSSAASVAYALAWSRTLSTQEHRSIAANPAQVFLDEDYEVDEMFFRTVASAMKRALILASGVMSEVTDAQVGTGKKPVVLVSGVTQQRVTSEGSPVVLDQGQLRTLASTETLII